jgi:hypothetical protein
VTLLIPTLAEAAACIAGLLGTIWWLRAAPDPWIRRIANAWAVMIIALLPALYVAFFGHGALDDVMGYVAKPNFFGPTFLESSPEQRTLKIAAFLRNFCCFAIGLSLFQYARKLTRQAGSAS